MSRELFTSPISKARFLGDSLRVPGYTKVKTQT